MWNASFVREIMEDARGYGFEVGDPKFSWPIIKAKRDAYIERLNGIYARNLDKANVTHHEARASFVGPRTVECGGTVIEGRHVLIAVGGYPTIPDIPGARRCGEPTPARHARPLMLPGRRRRARHRL